MKLLDTLVWKNNGNCLTTHLGGSGFSYPIDRDYGRRNIHLPH